MAKVLLKNSFTATSVPAGLSAGEIAVNVTDRKLFVGNAVGGVVTLIDPNALVTSVNGATGAVTIGVAPAWSIITADQTAAINTGYIANKGTLLTLTLPTTAAVGSAIRVSGMNAGLWKIAQNASGIIHFGKTDTTTGVGGYISSTLARDGVELVCVVANNEWNVISSVGNITIV
jgi:DNA-binding beta-propeller fold protein YncE